jgi:D-glycero-D-manno-heptose 1,7-bisphosphate phosphatase
MSGGFPTHVCPSSKPAGEKFSRALFVDRDGTLNPDFHYLRDADRLELYRGVGEALSLAHDHGFKVICVTNQSGIERGLYTDADVHRIHRRVNELLRPHRAKVDAFYYCPHVPETGCDCRKPRTLLFRQAAEDFGVEFRTSAMVGDRPLDVEAGRSLGMLTALVVPPGHERAVREEMEGSPIRPDIDATTLALAVNRILARG